jgi:hypothetical protein
VTPSPAPLGPTPALQIVTFSADSHHVLGYITFIDPSHDEPRQYNVEATSGVAPARVFPAGSQEHWDGGGSYQAEAERIAATILGATFPWLATRL